MLNRSDLDLTLFTKLFGNAPENVWLISPEIYNTDTLLATSTFFFQNSSVNHIYLHAVPTGAYVNLLHNHLKVHRTETLVLDCLSYETVKKITNLLYEKDINVLAIDNLEEASVKFIVHMLVRKALDGKAIPIKCGINIPGACMVEIIEYNATVALAYKSQATSESSTAAIYRAFSPPPGVLISQNPSLTQQQITLGSPGHIAAIAKAQSILVERPSILNSSPVAIDNPFVLPQAQEGSYTATPLRLG